MRIELKCAMCLCFDIFGFKCSPAMQYKCSGCVFDGITLRRIKNALESGEYRIV